MLELFAMTTVQEIKSAIGSLSQQEYKQLLSWIHAQDWAEWDEQLDADIASGKLDFLADEALAEKTKNKLRGL
jgi:hypothetical protein